MTPRRRFSRPRASSKSPAATRSAGSLRLRSHLVWRESDMVTFMLLFSSTGAASRLRSMPRSMPPRSRSSPHCAPAAATSPPRFMSSSSPQPPAPSPVSSGVSWASMKAGSGGAWADSKVLSEKIFLVDCSSGQLAASPVVPRQSGVGGIRRRAFGGMWAETSLPSSCSSSFGMYSVRLCAFAMMAASGTWPISAMIFTRSSTLPSISALWNLDMMSFLISAIFSIFRSFVMLPVMRYRKDRASKFLVFWYTISTICWLP
mmetsp:Transcript_29586/g.87815  ORF Transcript_29586/g.87815 Transcript_29586/m.87815 type:complete len:260 (+) Transcript_29586:884-1663(+)